MNNEPLVMSVDEWAQDTDGRQRNCSPAKASCSLQRGIAALRKLPAACSEELQPYESFLQRAAGNRSPTKASCSLQRGIATLRKLPAACSEELQPCESFLQRAARNRNPAKASCSLQREIATCESFL